MEHTFPVWHLLPFDQVLALMRVGLLPPSWDPRAPNAFGNAPNASGSDSVATPEETDREMRRRPRGPYARYIGGGPEP